MATRITFTDTTSTSAAPLYARDIATLSDAEKTFLIKLVELLARDAVDATTLSSLDKLISAVVAGRIDETEADAVLALLTAINAGTDVSTVVTAIDEL